MTSDETASRVEDLARDLDMIVFSLERAPERSADRWLAERAALRRNLEQIRDKLERLARALG